MKIVSVVGARPQFIKLAPLAKEINKILLEKSKRKKIKKHIIVHTGQHYDIKMSKIFFQELGIKNVKYNLNINGGKQGEQTGKMLIELEKVLYKERPELIIVFGDTNSTLAGSLAAAKLNMRSIHIEAGLRSFNKNMPEEINRIISDHICDYLFVPTENAMKNLKNEGLIHKAFLTGDIMVDSLKEVSELAKKKSKILDKLNLKNQKFFLLTLHRPYNVDNEKKLKEILIKLLKLKQKIVFPIHPRTKTVLGKIKFRIPENLLIIEPLGYIDFVSLQMNCEKVITDSGGIQKEAYILKKPCVTLRTETEWVETVEEGWNLLISIDDDDFIDKVLTFSPRSRQRNIFGSDVSKKMIQIIKNLFP